MADYVLVMQTGRVVEEGPTGAIFQRPQSDYTIALMHAAFAVTDFHDEARRMSDR